MQLFSGPFFTDRDKPDYITRTSDVMLTFIDELDKLPEAGDYWKLSKFEKTAFSLAFKLGLM